ncbi:MAG TPA: Ig-like domain repeat protein [Aeromicrobium sp.]|nr:Ig-like domain repeat protein [Aeromicrobium sp.]
MRRLGLMGLLSFLVLAALVPISTSASAFTLICTAKTKTEVAACDTSGYAKVMDNMHWRMYAGHNCTNYAAYRMKAAGVPEPKILMGNARDWAANATKLGYVVDQRPAKGSIAQWSKAASHVAYVEEVGDGYMVLSEDSYTSKTYRRYKVLSTDKWYPESFIHFKDLGESVDPPTPLAQSAVSIGVPKSVSSAMNATVTAKVTTTSAAIPVGTLRIRRGGVTVARVALTEASNGSATVSIPKMKRGTQWISAVFDGGSAVLPATSKSAKLKVTKPPKKVSSITTIAVPSGDVDSESRPRISLSVASQDGRVSTNAISVYVNGKRVAAPVLKKAHRGKVTVVLPALTPGANRISATYWGSKSVKRSYAAVQTIAAVEPTLTTASLVAPTVRAGQAAVVKVNVATKRGVAPVAGEIKATINGVVVASQPAANATNGTLALNIAGISPGSHQVSVSFVGARYQLSSTAPSQKLVVTGATTTAIAGAATVAKGAKASLTIQVLGPQGVGVATGDVQIFDGAKPITTVNLAKAVGGKIVVSLPVLASGAHQLSALFVGTELLEPSTSKTHLLTVSK